MARLTEMRIDRPLPHRHPDDASDGNKICSSIFGVGSCFSVESRFGMLTAELRHFSPGDKPAMNATFDATPPSSLLAVRWRLMMIALIASCGGYLVMNALLRPVGRAARSPTQKPPEINRWENEGGMIATTVPTIPSSEPSIRPSDTEGDVGTGSGEPPINT